MELSLNIARMRFHLTKKNPELQLELVLGTNILLGFIETKIKTFQLQITLNASATRLFECLQLQYKPLSTVAHICERRKSDDDDGGATVYRRTNDNKKNGVCVAVSLSVRLFFVAT